MLDNFSKIETQIKEKVFGQDKPISSMIKILRRKSKTKIHNSPMAVLTLIGNPSTGKTKLCSEIAKNLQRKILIIDMSEMQSEGETGRLNGVSKTWSNKTEGDATQFLKKHPDSIVLFKNIDLAHPTVIQVLSEPIKTGSFTDVCTGEAIDCTKSIFIATTSLGNEIFNSDSFLGQISDLNNELQTKSAIGGLKLSLSKRESLLGSRSSSKSGKIFGTEMLDLLSSDGFILFNRLDLKHLVNIAFLEFKAQIESCCNAELEGNLETIPNLKTALSLYILSLLPNIGARNMSAGIYEQFIEPVYEANETISTEHNLVIRTAYTLPKDVAEVIKSGEGIYTYRKKFTSVKYVVTRRTGVENEVPYVYLSFSDVKEHKLTEIDDLENGGLAISLPNINFENIAGHKEAKTRLCEVINLINDSSKLKKFDISIPKGMLMYGPPGTGKTMLAKALANEAGMPFIAVTGPEILDLDTLRNKFNIARKYAPSILFIDEIDVIGTRGQHGNDTVINQLLTEIDGFSTSMSDPIFLIAATNLPEKLDPAIIRSGRIDLHIKIPHLDAEAREHFIKKYNKLLKEELKYDELEYIINLTSGMSGADLEKVYRECSLELIRKKQECATVNDIVDLISTMKYGRKNSQERSDHLRKMTAYHEAGHALAQHKLNPHLKMDQITIEGRGNTAGMVTLSKETASHRILHKDEVIDDIAVLLSGRVAERMKFKMEGINEGASSDLAKATDIATYAISQLGMDDHFGLISLSNDNTLIRDSAKSILFERVKSWLTDGESRAEQLLDENWGKVEELATYLLDLGSMNQTQIADFFENN